MPFIPNTPESLLARNDSKNPATTCRGITSAGRPCRRPLAAEPDAPAPPPRRKPHLRVDDPSDESLYCWQHKEQASLSARSSPGPRTHTPILEERTSIDTLADRLGLLQVSEKPSKRPAANGDQQAMMTEPKEQSGFSFCCCFSIPSIEEAPPQPPRPKPRPLQSTTTASAPAKLTQHLSPSRPPRSSLPATPTRRPRHSSDASQTTNFLSLIPPSVSPQTASQLLAELAKPVSSLDDPGYIYMFWLTPDDNAEPPVAAARSMLAPLSRPAGSRRPSDVLASFAAATADLRGGPGKTKNKTILLKIGRATNVQRRLNEWTRQCEYNLSLIRYYPYIPSSSPGGSPGASPSAQPRKVPHSHKVERLVHIELAGMGLRVADREKCASCGREHREWFEVEASRKGVEAVDDVVKRWVDWDEGRGG